MQITKRDGSKQELDLNKIHAVLTWACEGRNDDALHPIKGVSISQIEMNAQLHFYDGMPTKQIHETLIKAASELISEDFPNYDQVAARLVWFSVRKEAFRNNLPPHLSKIIHTNVENGVYAKDILTIYSEEELDEINAMIDHRRDDLFKYAGAEQMRKKYLVQNRKTKKVFESFQLPYIMVAAILFSSYPKNTRLKYVKKYYDLISQHYISLPTPIMAGLRTSVKQFSSCTLIESGDSLKSINAAAAAIVDYASRKAGIGLNIGQIRAEGQKVRGGDAVTTGVVPFAKYFNGALKSCSQGAVRGASATFNYPIWHLEFERLIELKNNKGTEETRLRTVDYCIHLNRLFYELLVKKGEITFFSPEEVPELYKAFYSSNYKEFEKLYKQYEKDPKITKKKLPAVEVFQKILQERFETGRIYIMNADHVNTHSSFYESIKMTNLCLTGDTRIVTNKGIRTLTDLYSSQEEFNVSSDVRAIENQEIILKYGNRSEQRYSNKIAQFGTDNFRSSKVFMTNPNAAVFEVKTASGYSIKGTSDHKVMTGDGWKTIGELSPDDSLYIQSGEGLFAEKYVFEKFEYVSSNNKWNKYYAVNKFNVPTESDEELGELIGWLVGDGFIDTTKDHTYFVFGNKDYDLIPKVKSYINKILPTATISFNEFENSKQMYVQDRRLGLWLKSIGVSNKKSHEKIVPGFIWKSDKKTVAGFLRGLFSADGTVLASNKDNFSLALNSTSKKMLDEVTILLSNFGIRTSIYLRKEEGFELLPNSKRVKELYPTKEMFGLHIGKNNRDIFKNEIGFNLLYKNEKVTNLSLMRNEKTRSGFYPERYQDRIISVNFIEFAPVYDITVEESHSFIANGLVVHNCTEITLPTAPVTYAGDTQYAEEDGLIALCTLSAINWGKFIPFGDLDEESSIPQRQEVRLKDACDMAVRGLDALLDYQEYPVEAARRHSMRYRPLGIGIIGFGHWLAKGKLYWGEDNTLVEVETMMEKMAYYLTESSINLAEEFGGLTTKTKYHDGIFPIDTSMFKAKTKMDWNLLKAKAKKFGIRNATLMALMPSETSSQLSNETNGIEPPRDMVSIKGSKEGVLPQIVPEYTKLAAFYQTLWQVESRDYLKTIAILQKYIDQAISVNTSYDPGKGEIKMSKLIEDLLFAYKLGHKTLYYSNTRDGSGESDDSCDTGACKI
ncbi:hypothetical protein GW796_07210 [archaeon]|nr:hypothetical protein [archaeon]NCQ51671.1 hypothetical protein [archaeon]